MTLIYPATADAFRCIADACRHTCCKGWEIDIDPDTRAKYAATLRDERPEISLDEEVRRRAERSILCGIYSEPLSVRKPFRAAYATSSPLAAKGRCAKSVLTIRATATSFRHSPKLASGSAVKRRRI